MAQDFASFSWYDYDGEKSGTQVNVNEITELTLEATVTAIDTLRSALNGITLSDVSKSQVTDTLYDTKTIPSNQFAQRETKWVVIVQDASGNIFKANEIPTADLGLLEDGSKYIVKNGAVTVTAGAAAVNAFITAYEALALSQSGEALTILDVYQVGRNN